MRNDKIYSTGTEPQIFSVIFGKKYVLFENN